MFKVSMISIQSLCDCYNLSEISTISMSQLLSLCNHYNLYVITTIYKSSLQYAIYMSSLRSLCHHYNLYVTTIISITTTISMWLLRYQCDPYDLYAIATISTWFPQSLRDFQVLYVITAISVIATISMRFARQVFPWQMIPLRNFNFKEAGWLVVFHGCFVPVASGSLRKRFCLKLVQMKWNPKRFFYSSKK